MVQFKGNNYSKDKTILREVTLRYSSYFLLPTFIGVLFFILGFFLVIVGMGIIMGLFDIPTNDLTTSQLWIVLITLCILLMIISHYLQKCYNKLFYKKISLIELGKYRFKLLINGEVFEYRKADILKIRKIKFSGKARMLSEAKILIKMNNRTFRFSSDKDSNEIDSLNQHLLQWKSESSA
ncbi:hypothetical protein ATZ33_00885 [Enterococcus silesiacus]|uniref:DUF304 domain-containing protein n=1 Tax=Enterococcus silesiacus TaxID=332949 RepID=A0A0S3K6W2_9ENTE|nr:hypothetical protein [Enterococcus silesiacus]ALR99986.1 hypothetical protein ATZ33_00885 [Enterococcus silesiacus]OJG92702.1 hypothetical protein RV15_GL002647 [Enterococcus silesiacus]